MVQVHNKLQKNENNILVNNLISLSVFLFFLTLDFLLIIFFFFYTFLLHEFL